MGKYDHVTAGLPKLPTEHEDDPRWKQKVDAKKAEHEKKPREELLRLYKKIKDKKDELDALIKTNNVEHEALKQLIDASYEAEGIVSLRLDGVGNVRKQVEPHIKIEDQARLCAWMRANGMEDLISPPQVNFQRANSLTKERLLNMEEAPDGVKVFLLTKIIINK